MVASDGGFSDDPTRSSEIPPQQRRRWGRLITVAIVALGAVVLGLKVYGDDSPGATRSRPAISPQAAPTSLVSPDATVTTVGDNPGGLVAPTVAANGSAPAPGPAGASANPTPTQPSAVPTITPRSGSGTSTTVRPASGIDGGVGGRGGN